MIRGHGVFVIKNLNILGKRWRVVEQKPIAGEGAFGFCDSAKLIIYINSDQDEQQKRDTLLHEIVHAIDFTISLDLSEEQVHALGGGIYQVLTGNKKMVEWLLQK